MWQIFVHDIWRFQGNPILARMFTQILKFEDLQF